MSDLTINSISTAISSGTIDGDLSEWQDVKDQLSALLPNVSSEELTTAIQEYMQANPTATPAEVLEAVVTNLNPNASAEAVAALRTEWEQFADTTGLNASALLYVMAMPETEGTEVTRESVKDMMANLMMLMIEIFGEEAASQLLEGFSERDTIMELAKQKAEEMRTQAGWQLAMGLTSATIQIAGGLWSMNAAGKTLNMSESEAAAMNSKIQGANMAIGGSAKIADTFGSFMSTMIQANIAELDGEMSAAQIRKETADKLQNMAQDLINHFMTIYTDMASREYTSFNMLAS